MTVVVPRDLATGLAARPAGPGVPAPGETRYSEWEH